MKILNLSIEITKIPKNVESTYLSSKVNFIGRLSQLSELSR
ncbi:MAG: hypothetical protein NTW35_01520 [Candidatus Nomurabacteria bacterium]|nr:hypothetical protein [Candidatus Nomurabacteria bacterium]